MFLQKVFSKLRKVGSRPRLLRKFVLIYLNELIPIAYDRICFVIDRLISIVCIPLYDACLVPKKKNTHSIDVHFCGYKYKNHGSSFVDRESTTIEQTLLTYIGDGGKASLSYWDDDRPIVGYSFEFYRRIVTLNPKYLILSSYQHDSFFHPGPWVLARLKKRNIRLAAIWFDTCNFGFIPWVSPILDVIDLNIFNDNPTLDYGDSPEAQKFLEKSCCTLVPVLEMKVTDVVRDIDVVFFGQLTSYRDVRRPYVEFLNEAFEGSNVNWYCRSANREEWISDEKYIEIMSRSKIGISFSMSAERPQFKGRVGETMLSGGLLLEQRNKQTEVFFTEDEDYVAFSSKEELLEKIEYYLAHEDKRKKIAASGSKKAQKLFSGKLFWGKVFDSLGARL